MTPPSMSMHKLRQIAVVSLFSVSAACGGSMSSEPAGDYAIRVFNDSPTAMSNIRVRTSDRDEFTVPRLENGDLSDRYSTRSLHMNPAVTLTVGNETLTAVPIEGFSGFNSVVPQGAYVLVVSVSGSPRRLSVSL